MEFKGVSYFPHHGPMMYSCNENNDDRPVQWNLDITKGQGSGKLCYNDRSFVISRFFFIVFYYYWDKENHLLSRGLHYRRLLYRVYIVHHSSHWII